jgi:FlaG/FlaF family flagellin (archaellin)
MVAITVILAAVIGTFVLGLGDSVTGETAPQVSWETAEIPNSSAPNSIDVVIAHNGGDSVEASNLEIATIGTSGLPTPLSGTVSAGDEIKVTDVTDGEEVKVIWNAPDSDSSQELTSYEYTA